VTTVYLSPAYRTVTTVAVALPAFQPIKPFPHLQPFTFLLPPDQFVATAVALSVFQPYTYKLTEPLQP
jgi:hypothetical protein